MSKRPRDKASKIPIKKRKVVNNALITQFLSFPKLSQNENRIPPEIIIAQSQSKIENPKISEPKPTKIITWDKLMTPEEKEIKIKLDQEPEDEFYLNFFRDIFDVIRLYDDILVDQKERKILNYFENLTETGKILFVRLFMRKTVWININELNYKRVTNIFETARELIGIGLAQSFKSTLICDDLQLIYEFVSSLKKDLLVSLETHIRELLTILAEEDHLDIPVKGIEKSLKNPMYGASRKSNLSEVKELSLLITNLVSNELSSKNQYIETILEQLSYINKLKENLRAAAQISNIHKQLNSIQEEGLTSLIPPDFPTFIRLTSESMSLFTRLHHALSFYTCESLMQELVQRRLKSFSFGKFRCYVYNRSENSDIFRAVYKARLDSIEMEEAFNLYTTLEHLKEYRLPIEINYEIGKGIAFIALKRFNIFSCGEVSEIISEFIANYEIINIPDWMLEYDSHYRGAKVLYLSLEFIERVKDYTLAVLLLTLLLRNPFYYNKRGHWGERLIIITRAHLSLKGQASELVQIALADPLLRTGRRITLERQAQRLEIIPQNSEIFGKDYDNYAHPNFEDKTIYAACQNESGRPMFLTGSNQFLTVEEYALWGYKKDGWKGFHSENQILTSIYGILMGDAIFYDEIPYVFQTPFQSFPLDYKSEEFYLKREGIFQIAFKNLINCEDLYFYFNGLYERHLHTACSFISGEACELWGKHNLACIVRGLGKELLTKVCETLAKDFKHHNHGMPDLCLGRDEQVKFSEIKSTNDRLSDQQRFWIKLLSSYGCKIEVLHVIASN